MAYKGVAVPLLWTLLDKKGNSLEQERIALIHRFIRLFGIAKLDYLVADREFIGKDWLTYLQEQGIDFFIRIRENALVNAKKGQKVKNLFSHLKVNQGYFYQQPRLIYGVKVYVSARRSPYFDKHAIYLLGSPKIG